MESGVEIENTTQTRKSVQETEIDKNESKCVRRERIREVRYNEKYRKRINNRVANYSQKHDSKIQVSK